MDSESDGALVRVLEAEVDKGKVIDGKSDNDSDEALVAKPSRKPGQPTVREREREMRTRFHPSPATQLVQMVLFW